MADDYMKLLLGVIIVVTCLIGIACVIVMGYWDELEAKFNERAEKRKAELNEQEAVIAAKQKYLTLMSATLDARKQQAVIEQDRLKEFVLQIRNTLGDVYAEAIKEEVRVVTRKVDDD